MITSLEEIKNFVKIDNDDEDDFLNTLEVTAEQYLNNAGVDITTLTDADKNLAKLYILVLCNDWYNNRNLMEDIKVSNKTRFTLQSIMLQLKLDSDTYA